MGCFKQVGNWIEKTLLHMVSWNNDLELVKILLNKGVNLEEKDYFGWTALHFASESNCIEVAEFLLEKGADTEVEDTEGQTPYDVAVSDEMRDLLC